MRVDLNPRVPLKNLRILTAKRAGTGTRWTPGVDAWQAALLTGDAIGERSARTRSSSGRSSLTSSSRPRCPRPGRRRPTCSTGAESPPAVAVLPALTLGVCPPGPVGRLATARAGSRQRARRHPETAGGVLVDAARKRVVGAGKCPHCPRLSASVLINVLSASAYVHFNRCS